jgi:hypothetical protein
MDKNKQTKSKSPIQQQSSCSVKEPEVMYEIQSKVGLQQSMMSWMRQPRGTKSELQNWLLQAPTWSDDEYNNYLAGKFHLNQFAVK